MKVKDPKQPREILKALNELYNINYNHKDSNYTEYLTIDKYLAQFDIKNIIVIATILRRESLVTYDRANTKVFFNSSIRPNIKMAERVYNEACKFMALKGKKRRAENNIGKPKVFKPKVLKTNTYTSEPFSILDAFNNNKITAVSKSSNTKFLDFIFKMQVHIFSSTISTALFVKELQELLKDSEIKKQWEAYLTTKF